MNLNFHHHNNVMAFHLSQNDAPGSGILTAEAKELKNNGEKTTKKK